MVARIDGKLARKSACASIEPSLPSAGISENGLIEIGFFTSNSI
ncbi:hypothetical protein RHORCCE3_2200 [Rickettsia hoogstraalii str. RCCE3]|nr:hypothetical protein RHORCCE3_2200 [Rickettsia hoogstraalii str. RCCE3]